MAIASTTSTSGGVRVEAFPSDFVWGVATAIEGAATEGGRGPSIWDASPMSGRTHNGDIACDHHHRWDSHLDLLFDGYSKRFGLEFVDYATQSRTPKLSAMWSSELIARHSQRCRAEVTPT